MPSVDWRICRVYFKLNLLYVHSLVHSETAMVFLQVRQTLIQTGLLFKNMKAIDL